MDGKQDDMPNGTADVIPFELLKLDRAVAARLEEVLDFVPDSKKLVKEAFRKLRNGDRTAFEQMEGPVRDHLEAELLRLIQTDPSLRDIVTNALMREAQASILDGRGDHLAANLSPGEVEAVNAFRASLGTSEREALYDLMTAGAAASQRNEDRFASALLNEAIARAPDYFEAYLLRGVNHARNGRNSSALADAEVALRLCPDSGRAFELKASSLRGLDREDEAMSILGAAVERLPESAGLHVMRGAGFLRREAFRDAVRALDAAVKHGGDALAYVLRGEARLGLDAFASAQKDFESALAVEPQHSRALAGLVQSLARRRRWSELVSAATSLLELSGPDPDVLAHRAHARLELGHSFMALLDGLAALSVDESLQARRWADSAVARLGLEPTTGPDDLVVAIENCDLLERHGFNATAFLDSVETTARAETFAITLARAIRARETGTPRQVVRLAERAQKLPGATDDAKFLIAGALLEEGDFAGARRVVSELVSKGAAGGALGWEIGDALLIGAAAAEEAEGPAAALELLQDADGNHRVLREVGRLRSMLGDEEGARTALRAAYAADESDPTTVFENARLEAAHDPEAALDFLAHLIDIAPHYGWAITGESTFEMLHSNPRFQELLRASSTVAAALKLGCSFEEVNAYATEAGWVWRWLGRRTMRKPRLVSWTVPELSATAFYIDDAVSDVRALVFYGDDAATAAEATARVVPGSMRLSVPAVSANPVEAVRQLRVAGWSMGQGLSSSESFDQVVRECLEHHDGQVQWRAASAAALSNDSEVDAKLRELAYAAEDDRVREEALFTLRQSGGQTIPVNQHERWETFQVMGDRDTIERLFWERGLWFVAEHEPDSRSGYELTWASPNGETVVTYVEDEVHNVRLLSFAGDADDLVKAIANTVGLRSLEDAIAVAREDLSPDAIRAVAALVPEVRVDELVAFVESLLESSGPSQRAACDYLAGKREWLPAPVCAPVSSGVSRFILSPLESPVTVARTMAEAGWSFDDAEPTSDREHPSSFVQWRRGEQEIALRLHRFGFWSLDVVDPDEACLDVISNGIEALAPESLFERACHPDASVRADAIHQIGIYAEVSPTPDAVDALRNALGDVSLEVRTHALEATCIAARLRGLREQVAERAEVERDPDLRDYAAVLLEAMG